MSENNFNPMPMNSKSFINDNSKLENSLLNLEKNNINNAYLNRHFYLIPDNNQNRLANLLYPNTSICRDTGYLCKIQENSSRNLNRISYDKDKYETQNLNLNKNSADKINDVIDSANNVIN